MDDTNKNTSSSINPPLPKAAQQQQPKRVVSAGNNWSSLLTVARRTPVGGKFTVFCTRRRHGDTTGHNSHSYVPVYRWIGTVVSRGGGGDVFVRLQKGHENDVHRVLCSRCESGAELSDWAAQWNDGHQQTKQTINNQDPLPPWGDSTIYRLLTLRQTPPFVDTRTCSGSSRSYQPSEIPWGPSGISLRAPLEGADAKHCVFCAADIHPPENETNTTRYYRYSYTIQTVVDNYGGGGVSADCEHDDTVPLIMRTFDDARRRSESETSSKKSQYDVHSVLTAGLLPHFYNVRLLRQYRADPEAFERRRMIFGGSDNATHAAARNNYLCDPVATLATKATSDEQQDISPRAASHKSVTGEAVHTVPPLHPTRRYVETSYAHMVGVLQKQLLQQQTNHNQSGDYVHRYPNIDIAIGKTHTEPLSHTPPSNVADVPAQRFHGGRRLGEGTFGSAHVYYDSWCTSSAGEGHTHHQETETQIKKEETEEKEIMKPEVEGGICIAVDEPAEYDYIGPLKHSYRRYPWIVGKSVTRPEFLTHGGKQEDGETENGERAGRDFSVHTTLVREMVAMATAPPAPMTEAELFNPSASSSLVPTADSSAVKQHTRSNSTSVSSRSTASERNGKNTEDDKLGETTILGPLMDVHFNPMTHASSDTASVEFLMPFVSHDLHKLLYYPPVVRNPNLNNIRGSSRQIHRKFVYFDTCDKDAYSSSAPFDDYYSQRSSHNGNKGRNIPMPVILRGVLTALASLHASGRAHRDVKPSNVLITSDGGVRLADFGWSRAYNSGTEKSRDASSTNTSGGNPYPHRVTCPPCAVNYRPMELLLTGLWRSAAALGENTSTHHGDVHHQRTEHPNPSKAPHLSQADIPSPIAPAVQYYDCEGIDMYSFGCLLFEALSGGARLWEGKTELAVIYNIVKVMGVPSRCDRHRINSAVQGKGGQQFYYVFPVTTSDADDDDCDDAAVEEDNLPSPSLRTVTLTDPRRHKNVNKPLRQSSSAINTERSKGRRLRPTHCHSTHSSELPLRVSYTAMHEVHKKYASQHSQHSRHDRSKDHSSAGRNGAPAVPVPVPPLLRLRCLQHNIKDERIIALLASLVNFDPSRRPTAAEALHSLDRIYSEHHRRDRGYTTDSDEDAEAHGVRRKRGRSRSRNREKRDNENLVPWIALPEYSVHSLPWPPN